MFRSVTFLDLCFIFSLIMFGSVMGDIHSTVRTYFEKPLKVTYFLDGNTYLFGHTAYLICVFYDITNLLIKM